MKRLPLTLAVLALACGATQAHAQVFTQPAPTGPLASPGSVTYNFNAGAGPGLAEFDINGFLSLDGFGNCCTDIFTLSLNSLPIYSASFDLGGGGTNQVLLAPVGATQTANSFGLFNGGLASLSVPLNLVDGSNSLTFAYSGVPQGTGDEAWGISNLIVTGNAFNAAIPEPSTWAMLLIGFGALGAAMRRKRGPKVSVTYA